MQYSSSDDEDTDDDTNFVVQSDGDEEMWDKESDIGRDEDVCLCNICLCECHFCVRCSQMNLNLLTWLPGVTYVFVLDF